MRPFLEFYARLVPPLHRAPLRSAPLRSAPLRAAALRSAPLRCAPRRAPSAPLRPAPRLGAPPRSAPLRAAPLRPHAAPLHSAPLRAAPRPLGSAPPRAAPRRGCALQTFEAKVAAGQFVPNFFSFPDAPRPRKKVGTFLPVSLVTVHAARLRAFLSAAVLPSVVACLRASVLRLSCGGWRAHTCSAGVYTQGVRWCWRTCCARACALLFVRCLRHASHNAPRHGWRKS